MRMVKQLDYTMRSLSVEKGSIARSPLWLFHAANRANVATEPQRRPIIVALSHAQRLPPKSIASHNMMAAGAKIENPMRSNS